MLLLIGIRSWFWSKPDFDARTCGLCIFDPATDLSFSFPSQVFPSLLLSHLEVGTCFPWLVPCCISHKPSGSSSSTDMGKMYQYSNLNCQINVSKKVRQLTYWHSARVTIGEHDDRLQHLYQLLLWCFPVSKCSSMYSTHHRHASYPSHTGNSISDMMYHNSKIGALIPIDRY